MKKSRAIYRRIIVYLVIVFIFVLGGWFFLRPFGKAAYRQSVVVVEHNSVKIISFSPAKDQVTVLRVPGDVAIDATGGYGRYTLASLFSLDHLDHKNGSLFVSSVSDAFGLPVPWYVVSGSTDENLSGISLVRSIFSWKSVWNVLTRQTESTVPVEKWIAFVLSVQSMSSDSVTTVTTDTAFVESQVPDGSTIRVLDQNRFDFSIGNAFLDAGIRGEDVSIAVYNTTLVPSVGQRAARIMSHMGLQLVFVGNAASDSKECVIRATAKNLRTKTAQFIREYFHCVNDEQKETDTNAVADLSLYLGSQYASQFEAL